MFDPSFDPKSDNDIFTDVWFPRDSRISCYHSPLEKWTKGTTKKLVSKGWTIPQAKKFLRDYEVGNMAWVTSEVRSLRVGDSGGNSTTIGAMSNSERFNTTIDLHLKPYETVSSSTNDLSDGLKTCLSGTAVADDGNAFKLSLNVDPAVQSGETQDSECCKVAQKVFTTILMKSMLHFVKKILNKDLISFLKNELLIDDLSTWSWAKVKKLVLSQLKKPTVVKPLETLVTLLREDKEDLQRWARSVLARKIHLTKLGVILPDPWWKSFVARQCSQSEQLLWEIETTKFSELIRKVGTLSMKEVPVFRASSVKDVTDILPRYAPSGGKEIKKKAGTSGDDSSHGAFFCSHHKCRT